MKKCLFFIIVELFKKLKTRCKVFILSFQKFLSMKKKVENGERKIEDIIKSSKDSSTNYKNQAIVVLQQDRVVQTAGINLYYKHPEVSTMYLYDKKSNEYTLVAGKEQAFGQYSRIQVVGHASDKTGEMLFAKLNGEDLAKALSNLPGIKSNVGRIGLVGCEAGKSENFLKQFLRSLKNDMNIDTTISARKGVVVVTDSGRKIVGEITENGFVWPEKSTDQKVVLKLDENNEIKKIEEPSREYVETSCDNCDREVLMDDAFSITDIKKVKITNSGDGTSKILTPEQIDYFLNVETYNKFKNNIRDLLSYYVDTKAKGFNIKDIDIYNNKLAYRTASDSRIIERPIAAKIDRIDLKMYNNKDNKVTIQREIQVRTFSNPREFIDEINLWGLIGPLLPESYTKVRHVYYRIGNNIYRMNPTNFYIYFHGIPDNLEWKWKQNGKDVNYEHAQLSSYPDLWEQIQRDNILNVLDDLLDGRVQALDKVSPVDMQFALAVGFSETIRNFRNYPVLKHIIEVNKGNGNKMIDNFLDVNPMTRGGSWNIFGDRERSESERSKIDPGFDLKVQVKRTGFYGFEGISYQDRSRLMGYNWKSKKSYGNKVLPREIFIVQQHILINVKDTSTVEQVNDNTITENLPEMEIGDLNKILSEPLESDSFRQDALSDSEKLQNRYDMSDEKMISVNAVKLEMMLQMDQKYLENLVADDLQKFLEQSNGDYFLVEDSIEITDDKIKYSVQHKNNKNMIKELSVKYEKSKLQITRIFDDLNKQAETKIAANSKLQSATNVAGKFNDLLDVQGILAGFGNAIDSFSNGDVKNGGIALAQSLHGTASFVGEFTGLSKSIRKGIGAVSRKSLTSINKHVSSAIGTSKQISTLGKAGKILSKIPFVSIGFGIYSAITNFQSGTIKGYINFGFDVLGMVISTAAIAFPPLEIISLALGVIQIGFNEFWESISNAWNELDVNATIGDKVVAVLKGIGTGMKSLFQQFTLVGQIWGAVEQANEIKQQQQKDQELLRDLRDINNYYKIEKQGEGAVINFAAGSHSWNGGDIQFMLGDDGYATITTIPTTYLEHLIIKLLHNYKKTKRVYVGKNTNSIVAGFGQTHEVKYTRQSAKFFWFIPVYSADVISGLNPISSSLRGKYYGNANNNTFYTVQELPDSYRDQIHYTLEEYTYGLYGEAGDDMFFLGPQAAHVEGGPGYDYYYVPSYGGFININNYAKDMKHDILYIDCKITDISASRYKSDLVLTYHASHIIKIKNWYTGDKFRHMSFRADDGIIFNVSQTAFGNPRVEALAVIMDGEQSGKTINIQTRALRTVVLAVGSDYNDKIYGNSGNNKIIGGKGDDYMYGANGKDIYEINTGDGCDTINNYATDENMDIVTLSSKYNDISIYIRSRDLLLMGKNGVCVYLKHWFASKKYRHLTFLSADGILFEVSETKNDTRKMPFTVYMENDIYRSNTVNISATEYSLVKTVIGSSQSDTIYGNHHGNILNGERGNDMIAGGDGPDSYIIRENGGHDTIDNFAEDKTLDIMFFQESYSNIKVSVSMNDLVINSNKGFGVTVKNWFKDERFQHMKVRTTDGVEFFLPVSKEHFVGKIPVTIDKSKYKHGVRVDANQPSWQSVFKIIGSNYTDVLKGNLLNNVVEPRQGGGYFSGNNGSDNYIIQANAGPNNIINNFALDDNTDVIDMDVEFADINVTEISNISVRLVGPNNLGVTIENFLKGTEYQHLIIESSDGIGFGINNETLSTQPLVIDKTNTDSDQVIDTLNDDLRSTKKVFGSLIQPNDINGNLEDNAVIGGSSVDTLKGNMGNDYLNGGNGQDVLMGGDGDDTIVGGEGSDWISGDFGDDVIFAGEGADNIVGGSGSDTVVFIGNISAQTGVFVDIQSGRGIGSDAEGDIYIGVENLMGTEFDDILIGNDEDNDIYGFGGNDIIFPNGGKDILNGGDGNDIYALESTSGIKYLILESKDNSSDTISLINTTSNRIRAHRHSTNHLMLQVGYNQWLFWCPNHYNFGPFIISNWSHSEHEMDFRIIFEDVQIDKSRFTLNIHDNDINMIQQFFCENQSTIIAIICIVAIITIAIVLCCVLKCCRKSKNLYRPDSNDHGNHGSSDKSNRDYAIMYNNLNNDGEEIQIHM